MSNKVSVIAAPGRRCPIHPSVATAPGGKLLVVDEYKAVELPKVSYVTRRMLAGDLLQSPPAKPTPRPPAEEQAPAAVTKEAELEAGGPPAVFGDAPELDTSTSGPRTAAPKKKEGK